MKNLLKNNPILNILLIFLFIQIVSGCVVVSANESKTPIPEHDMDAFAKNHLSKDKKVYIETHLSGKFNEKEQDELRKVYEETYEKRFKELHFAQFVEQKKDADYFVNLDSTFDLNMSKALYLISAVTLYIIPFYAHAELTLKMKITNKNGQTREYFIEDKGNIYQSIFFLPIAPFLLFKKNEAQKKIEDLIYKAGNDPIFQEKPNVSSEKIEKSQPLSNS